MSLPNAIDEDPHGERLVGDGFRKFQTAASLGEQNRIAFGKQTQEVTRNRSTRGIVGISAECDLNVFRLLGVFDAMNERIVRFHFLAYGVNIALDGLNSR